MVKKVWGYLENISKGIKHASEFRDSVNRETDIAEVRKMIGGFFS